MAEVVHLSMKKIDPVKKRFVEDGLDITLNDRRGSHVYKKEIGDDFGSAFL